MISDVPTQEASLPMILAGAGIRYFSSGINNDRAYNFTQMQNKCPCWWEGPDGSRVLMMYTWQYAQAAQWALTESFDQARARVLENLRQYEARADYPYDAVFLHGAVSDNQPLNVHLAEVAKQWNDRYEYPKIILSHNAEFFQYIEKKYGEKLPVYRGSAGTYWEDGAGSSARETALDRASPRAAGQRREAAGAGRSHRGSASLQRRGDVPGLAELHPLRRAHLGRVSARSASRTSDFTKAQWKIKAQYAVDADKQSRAILDRGIGGLASLVRTDGPALVVFNPSSWPRTDVVRVTLPAGVGLADADVPYELTSEGTLLLVKDVPACGYRVLKLAPRARRTRRRDAADRPAEGNVIESRFYRVQFDPQTGGIVSIRDKELDRELGRSARRPSSSINTSTWPAATTARGS